MHKLSLRLDLRKIFVLIATMLAAGAALAESRQDVSLATAGQVLNELRQSPDQGVPTWLLERAYAVAVVPGVIKGAFFWGGRRGKGVLTVRKDNGSWSDPVFINLTGGSFGLQVGVQSTDVLLVFTSKAGVEGIVGGKVTLGADASVAAGPVGRQTGAATDVGLNAQVYSYSRNSGIFIGVALDGSAITIDKSSNGAFYGRPGILASDIIAGNVTTVPPAAKQFLDVVTSASSSTAAVTPASAAGTAAPASAASTPNDAAPKAANEGALTTYPMEDAHPGAAPPP